MKQYVKAVCGVLFCLLESFCARKGKALLVSFLCVCILFQNVSVLAEDISSDDVSVEIIEETKADAEKTVEEKLEGGQEEINVNNEEKEEDVEKNQSIPLHILNNCLSLPTVRSVGIPAVGDVVTGSCFIMDSWMIGIQSYFNVGNFTGDLTNAYAVSSIHCMDPTAAEPYQTSASYSAKVVNVNKKEGYIEYSVYITPPGVTDGVSRDPAGCLYGYQHIGGNFRVNWEFAGSLKLKKNASDTTVLGSAEYSLRGAVYGVFDEKSEEIGRLTTNEDGVGTLDDIPAGEYTVREVFAPNGFLLDSDWYNITINAGKETTLEVQDEPQFMKIELHKVDSEMSQDKPQGAATLEGAVYEIRNESSVVVEQLITDDKGEAVSSELPLGTYSVKEVKSPDGYLLDGSNYIVEGKPKDQKTKVIGYSVVSKEDVIRGDVEIIKLKETEEDQDTVEGLENVEFTITSDLTGKVVKVITTDKNGFATTAEADHPKGTLVCGTYTITETKTPVGLKAIEPFKVKIVEDGVTLKGIYKEDKMIVSPLSVVKIDKSTGRVIPVAGAKFRLLDEEKNPIIMTTHYPNTVLNEYYETDENGQFTFPDKLKWGQYYLEEISAPTGYLKGELLSFEVTEGNTWENPIIIKYEDENAMGQIQINKVDADTKELLDGAVFEIRAAEDIVTPDGTIRLKKGALAERLKIMNGKAISGKLYFGKYEVIEMEQPEGYALANETYDVSLEYKDQLTPIVTKEMEIENKSTKILIRKKDKETGNPMSGVAFKVWKDDQDATEYTTDENGQIMLEKIPAGLYHFQEIETLPGYLLDETIVDIEVDESGRISEQEFYEVEVYNVPTQLIKTTAKEQNSGNKKITVKEECVLVDTVEFKNLSVGQEYTVQGILMDKKTGNPLKIKGENVIGKTVFTAKEKNGTIDVVFTFDASELAGQEIVVFEKVYVNGVEILTHEDLNDKDQTIVFVEKREKNLVNTGDMEQTVTTVFGMLCLGCLLLGVLIFKKKRFYK